MMKQLYSSITFEVQPDETVPLRVSRGVAITVAGERVWVTRSADQEDYWVEHGESLALRPGELLWISTDGARPARVTVTLKPRCAQRFAAWLGRAVAGRLGVGLNAGWLSV
jgi:hypothetical protein